MSFLRNPRIIILLVAVAIALYAIFLSPAPFQHISWESGAAIRSVAHDSAAAAAGIQSPNPRDKPLTRERVIMVNGERVTSADEYHQRIAEIMQQGVGTEFTLRTDRNLYFLTLEGEYETVVLPELERVNVTEEVEREVNGTTVKENITRVVEQNKTTQRLIGVEDVGLTVYDAPRNNIRKGLDLSGGTRVILKPREPVDEEGLKIIMENIDRRLNVYGLSDLTIRHANDLSGDDFIVIEIAGANQDEVRDLISSEGRFEGKIANQTVFTGEERDIRHVCRSSTGSCLVRVTCNPSEGSWVCNFEFGITLSDEAADRQAAVTKTLTTDVESGGAYLNKPLDLYLDGELVSSLRIAADLKGRAINDILISGGKTGETRAQAQENAENEMRRLQAVMSTGSLPVKLDIVKADSISPVLGSSFVKNAFLVGLISILVVTAIVMLRYKRWLISIPIIVTMGSELLLILGFAAIAGWQLDLAAIAAIIIAVGTGVDDQIVIADEALQGDTQRKLSWKDRFKNAFFIITAAYITTVAAMLPLLKAGAGILLAFGLTTIVGVSVGVFITRPAFAALVELLVKE
ncbi:hypothetical protein D6789_02215 [Candidatus Woesearchaeota archaeon]|nr:MAG: hypothetical protein D6789_02215 [Candidatus Woesearchaeota archaeon]